MGSTTDFLRSIPYFSSLSERDIERVERAVIRRSFDKGEMLLLEGGSAQGLYIVESGQVRIFKTSSEGREQVILLAGPGMSFNDVPVFDGGPNPASASALKPSKVLIVPKDAILSLIEDCPAADGILGVLAGRIRHLMRLVEDLSFRDVVSRLARILLDLAVPQGGEAPVPKLTQDEMAAMAGTVRDMIGRALKALEKSGAIRIEGRRIIVVDPKILKALV